MFVPSLLAGSGLAVWVLILLSGFSLPVERHFHNESSFWVRSCCLGFELVSGSVYFTGSGLAVWVLNLFLGQVLQFIYVHACITSLLSGQVLLCVFF